jgi:hypothetical protein
VIESIKPFLKPDEKKLAIFAALAFVAIVVFFFGSDFVGFIDTPEGHYPIADLSNEKLGFTATMYLGIAMTAAYVVLFLPVGILVFPFFSISIPYAPIVAFVVLEAVYLYVIACLASSVLGFIQGKKTKK